MANFVTLCDFKLKMSAFNRLIKKIRKTTN